jgi:hypothetical protein
MYRDGTLVGSSARTAGGGVTRDRVLASASGAEERGATHARALRCIRVHTVGAMMENCIHVCPQRELCSQRRCIKNDVLHTMQMALCQRVGVKACRRCMMVDLQTTERRCARASGACHG